MDTEWSGSFNKSFQSFDATGQDTESSKAGSQLYNISVVCLWLFGCISTFLCFKTNMDCLGWRVLNCMITGYIVLITWVLDTLNKIRMHIKFRTLMHIVSQTNFCLKSNVWKYTFIFIHSPAKYNPNSWKWCDIFYIWIKLKLKDFQVARASILFTIE